MVSGCLNLEVLLSQNDYEPDELELIFIYELLHHKHKNLVFKKFVMIAVLLHCVNLITLFLLRTINYWCECMSDLSMSEMSGNLKHAGSYYRKIVGLIPHDTHVKRDSLFISTLSKMNY